MVINESLLGALKFQVFSFLISFFLIANASAGDEPIFDWLRKSPGIFTRIQEKRTRAKAEEKGITLRKWRILFEDSFREALDRDPTPAELDLEADAIEALLRRFVKHSILTKSSSRDVPIGIEDLQHVKILGYHAISSSELKLFIEKDLQGLILCRERNVCFIPEIDEILTSNVLEKGEWRIQVRDDRPHRRSRSKTRCPVFKTRPGEKWINIPFPRITHEEDRTRLFWIQRTQNGFVVRTHTLHHAEVEGEAEDAEE